MIAPATHVVLLPTYNTGPRLCAVVAEVLEHWPHVLVVVDGSTDGSERAVLELTRGHPTLEVAVMPHNTGKGGAVLTGAALATVRGFTHALVMDADGQHPAGSIVEFMAASRAQPGTLILGRPVFPANIPAARLHGRKLSVGLVHLELLGTTVADPLFGFRVYPLAPLLAVLGPRRGGRRYDFDTEAAVRLGWAGVPMRNLAAPVRYFSRAEGGVSHFHYLRANVTLVWLHLRLLAELLLWRWPAMLLNRSPGRIPGLVLALLLLGLPAGHAGEPDALVNPAHRLTSAAIEWRDLVEAFARHPDTAADFTERRFFPFKHEPVEAQGEVRVSVARGLSLHYTTPAKYVVILDEQGLLMRAATGEKAVPADPRAAASLAALRQIVRFDLTALETDFEIYGRRDGTHWTLALVPRTEAARRNVGRISVAGEAATMSRIELRRSPNLAVEITIAPPRPPATFTAEELKAFFR